MSEGSESGNQLPVYSEIAPVVVGTAVWALLFVIGLVIRPALITSGREWWIWSAAAGIVQGLAGYLYLRLRRPHLLAREPAATARPADQARATDTTRAIDQPPADRDQPLAEPRTPDRS